MRDRQRVVFMSGDYMPGGRRPAALVFDMDETLGHFGQLGAFWGALERAHSRTLSPSTFREVASLYPEYVRPGIPYMLAQAAELRDAGHLDAIGIYTNNNGPIQWAQYIAQWLESLAGRPVFDFIIPAYMIGGRLVDPRRTGHAKSPGDFSRCTGLPPTTRICFVDDQEHPPMRSPNVYYIKPRPFHAGLLPGEMAARYLAANPTVSDARRARLGRAILADPHLDPPMAPARSDADLREESDWIAAHLTQFLSAAGHPVTRRARARQPRRGRTRRSYGRLWS